MERRAAVFYCDHDGCDEWVASYRQDTAWTMRELTKAHWTVTPESLHLCPRHAPKTKKGRTGLFIAHPTQEGD